MERSHMQQFYLIGPFYMNVDLTDDVDEYLGFTELFVVLNEELMAEFNAKCQRLAELDDPAFVLSMELPAGTVYVKRYSDSDDENHGKWVLLEDVDGNALPSLCVYPGEKVLPYEAWEKAEDDAVPSGWRQHVTVEIYGIPGQPYSYGYYLSDAIWPVQTDDIIGYLNTHHGDEVDG